LVIEHAHARKARSTKDGAAAGDEITSHELPKDVALRTGRRVDVASWVALLIAPHGLPINHSGRGLPFQNFDLPLKRTGQARVVVIQETQVLASTSNNSNISRSGYLLIAFDANVVNARQTLANPRSFIVGSVVDYYNLWINSRSACTLNSSGQEVWAVMRGDYYACKRHEFDGLPDELLTIEYSHKHFGLAKR